MSQEQKSASIVKSGFLWKKGEGVLGATYKERLFELKLTGKLDYFDVSSGTKIFKGTILLTSSSKIIIRKNLPSDQNKFIIKTQQRVWYLWCKDKNANQQIQQWCNSINDMINSSKSLTKNNDQKQTEITHENTNNNIIEQTNASSDELIGDSPTPQDIIAMHPTNPNQPFNPFYGSSISTTSVTEQQKHDINPYYASLNSKPSNVMESKEDINILPTAPMDMELNEEFENMNIDIGFKISENVSLKSVLFGSWISYNIECEYLYGVTNLPMINERFIFKCIDNMNNIYTIQTCNGLYLSGSVDGNIKFVKKYYGIYEQWIIKYKHINNIYIQSKYYNTYFGIDSNGFCHHKYPSVSNIIMFELSPPVIIHKNNANYINNNINNISDTSIQYPTINNNIIQQTNASSD
eukprot:79766_1